MNLQVAFPRSPASELRYQTARQLKKDGKSRLHGKKNRVLRSILSALPNTEFNNPASDQTAH